MPYLGQIRRVGPHSHFLKFHCYFIAPVLTVPQNKVSQGCKLGWGGVLEKISKLVSLKPFERELLGQTLPTKNWIKPWEGKLDLLGGSGTPPPMAGSGKGGPDFWTGGGYPPPSTLHT